MKTQLLLNFDNSNPKVLGIRDVSYYNPILQICEPYIIVQAPGFTTMYSVDVTPHDYHPVNSNTINLTKTTNTQDLVYLPDGLWYVKYSIQPHSEVYTEHWFYRTSALRCDFYKALLAVDMPTCPGYTGSDVNEAYNDLMLADFHLNSAEANINESYSDVDLANAHYAKAKEIIIKYLNYC